MVVVYPVGDHRRMASAALVLKWPLIRDLPSGSIAGIALLIAGLAYVGIAFTTRNA